MELNLTVLNFGQVKIFREWLVEPYFKFTRFAKSALNNTFLPSFSKNNTQSYENVKACLLTEEISDVQVLAVNDFVYFSKLYLVFDYILEDHLFRSFL